MIAEGACSVLRDEWDKVLGTHVLIRHWSRSWDNHTQAAIDWLDTYASADDGTSVMTAGIYVTDPKTRTGQTKDTHEGEFRHVKAYYSKPRDADHGITQVLYGVYSPADIAALSALTGRYAYGRQALNLFGIEEGVGESASVTFRNLKPDDTTRGVCEAFTGAELKATILALYQTTLTAWEYADHRWDDRTEPGTANFSVLFRKVTWDKDWTDKRVTGEAGTTDGRLFERALRVNGVPTADLQSEFDALGQSSGHALRSKSYAETGSGAGSLQAGEIKVNSLANAKMVESGIATTTIAATGQVIPGRQVVVWRNISEADMILLAADFDANAGDLSASTYHPAGDDFRDGFPAGYIGTGFDPHEQRTSPKTYTVRITAADGAYYPTSAINYGVYGPFYKRTPIHNSVTKAVTGYHKYCWGQRISAGASAAEAFAKGETDVGDETPDANTITNSSFGGSWGRYVGVVMWYVEMESV